MCTWQFRMDCKGRPPRGGWATLEQRSEGGEGVTGHPTEGMASAKRGGSLEKEEGRAAREE